MAIEGIKSSVMNQVNRISEPVVTENSENVQVRSQQAAQAKGRPSGYESKDGQSDKANDDGQNIQDVSPEKVKQAIEEINKKIRPTRTQCEFKFHDKTNRICIRVKDSETQEVIKEIPPEKMLDMVAKTLELAGLLVDEKM
ncbi:MAG: flagellar protein FlaG [Lachnospiraceae bacterium]|nr:flagellar protein FlaG [Lachnospiraceae bacterium]